MTIELPISKDEFDSLVKKVESGEMMREKVFELLGLNAKINSHLLVNPIEEFIPGMYMLALRSGVVETSMGGKLTKALGEISFREGFRSFTT